MKTSSFLSGFFVGLVLIVVVAFFVVPRLGIFDITAIGQPNILDWWGNTNLDKTLSLKAPKTKLPPTANPAKGFEHYKSTCLHCHGAPDSPREAWAKHMLPLPPHLQEEDTQQMPDGQLFYIVSNGIRMTGMPAFSPDHSQEDIWNMVAIVRGLNRLTEDQKQQLQKRASLFGQ